MINYGANDELKAQKCGFQSADDTFDAMCSAHFFLVTTDALWSSKIAYRPIVVFITGYWESLAQNEIKKILNPLRTTGRFVKTNEVFISKPIRDIVRMVL